jgi:hypothetical protein
MNKVNKFLSQRLKKVEKTSKMSALATQSMEGNLTSFSGVFGFTDLNSAEKEDLALILRKFAQEDGSTEVDEDLKSLITLTSEVKAINNQALILHGERIKAAQTLLKRYKDGAFTSWLITTYGNRQTPYNFLQYYEFYLSLPQTLRPLIEIMPKQAIYTLASREGTLEDKQLIVENYQGETKKELIQIIRETFPISEHDKRTKSIGVGLINTFEKARQSLRTNLNHLSEKQKSTLKSLLKETLAAID